MLTKAVELDPSSGAFQDSLGWVYFRLGDLDRAEKHLTEAVRLDPFDATVKRARRRPAARTRRQGQGRRGVPASARELTPKRPARRSGSRRSWPRSRVRQTP